MKTWSDWQEALTKTNDFVREIWDRKTRLEVVATENQRRIDSYVVEVESLKKLVADRDESAARVNRQFSELQEKIEALNQLGQADATFRKDCEQQISEQGAEIARHLADKLSLEESLAKMQDARNTAEAKANDYWATIKDLEHKLWLERQNAGGVKARAEAVSEKLTRYGVPAGVETSKGVVSYFPDDRVEWAIHHAFKVGGGAPTAFTLNVAIQAVREHGLNLPGYSRLGDACIDLRVDLTGDSLEEARKAVLVHRGAKRVFHTGFRFAIPPGWCGVIFGRSGLAFNELVRPFYNGVIDSNYRGEVKLLMENAGGGGSIQVNHGDVIAQMMLIPCGIASFNVFPPDAKFPESNRGEEGFGSSTPPVQVVPEDIQP